MFAFIILSCLFLAAFCSSAGKVLTPWLSCVGFFKYFLIFTNNHCKRMLKEHIIRTFYRSLNVLSHVWLSLKVDDGGVSFELTGHN